MVLARVLIPKGCFISKGRLKNFGFKLSLEPITCFATARLATTISYITTSANFKKGNWFLEPNFFLPKA